jgi:hypothetical protein
MLSSSKVGRRWHWAVLGALLLVEFLLLDRVLSRHHAWIYPRWNDQIQYLTEAYTGHEYLKAHGFLAGLWQTLVNPSAQGTLHDFFAVLIFAFAGPSRSAALSVNVFYFLAWQAAFFFAVVKTSGSRPLAFAAVGLLLSLHTPWSDAAGALGDFRLDWGATCAFGVALALALCTEGFRSTRWSLAFGAGVGFLLVTRFLTGAYVVPIFVALFLSFLFGDARRRRAGNLLLASVTGCALAAPFFWLNREWVYNYYLIGHFTGPESAIRSPNMGMWNSFKWIADLWWWRHVLPACGWLVLGASVGLGLLAAINRWRKSADATPPRAGNKTSDWIFLGATFLFAPLVVLTLHSQKSVPVLSILLPGACVLVLGAWRFLVERTSTRTVSFIAGAMLLLGGLIGVRQLATPDRPSGFNVSARKVNELADYFYRTQVDAKLAAPRIGVDQITDAFDGQIMRVLCYERHKVWVPFMMTLPTGIMEEKPELLMERLAQSDFMLVTEQMPGDGQWPYDRQMRRLYPQIKIWCEQNLRPVTSFRVFDREMVLYQRRDLPGLSSSP